MIIKLIILIVLILINGIFSASEIAFLSLNRTKLELDIKAKKKKALRIKNMLEDTSGFLATIQIGITFAGFLASAFASETFADYIMQSLSIAPASYELVKSIVVIIITLVLSYFTLVIGELVPKKLGLAYPEKIANTMVNPIYIIKKITSPFVFLLKASTNFICKLLKIKEKKEEGISEEELKLMIAESMEDGKIEKQEKNLIFNIFKFNDTEVNKIMTPRKEVAIISEDASVKDLVFLVKKHKFTRFPVYDKDNNGKIIGILNIKDLILKYSTNRDEKLKITDIMREPTFIFENEKVDDVFKLMQDNKLRNDYSM